MNTKKSILFRITALTLIIALLCPLGISAAEPRASAYLTSYNGYPYAAGWGKIQIWFDVTGTDYMADIGGLSVKIYESTDGENWTWVKSFTHDSTPGMLGHNKIVYQSHVEYQGTIGRYYKAYIGIYAGDGTNGDSRYFWTGAQKATLFAQ